MNPNTNCTTADVAFGLTELGRATIDGRKWVAFDDGAYRHVVEQCHWNNATAMLPGQNTADAYTDWCGSGRECWADDATAEMVARQCSLTYINSATDGCCGRIDVDLDDDDDDDNDDAAPRLMDYHTGEDIRAATAAEIEASDAAGPEGVILLAADGSILRADDAGADDARRVYVIDGDA